MNSVNEITRIRRRVLTEVARLCWQGKLEQDIDSLPDKLVSQQTGNYRCCEFKEKAIYGQRITLAMGLSLTGHSQPLSELAQSAMDNRFAGKNQVEVVEYACDRCPINTYFITNACRNCLVHSCQNACPKEAISVIQNQAYIDYNRCKECGLCRKACRYNAIIEIKRPCEQACAVKAINAADDRKAVINYGKCVDCGACIVSCPFGAISDRAQLLAVIKMLKGDQKVVALVAPSLIGQFGQKANIEPIRRGLQQLGFAEVIEIAGAAAEVAAAEAEEFLARVPAEVPFMTSSCCPAFTRMLENNFSQLSNNQSGCPSPMAAAAESWSKHDDVGLVFIGPCIAKKREAIEGGLIDAVLTFEELAALLVAAGINLAELETADQEEGLSDNPGQRFAYAGGVTENVRLVLQDEGEEKFQPFKADGLDQCIDSLKKWSQGEITFNYLEGMGCSGGCLGGPGVLVDKRYTKKYLLERIQMK